MEQYFSIKERYKEELLFFRLGDFYELFYDDALIASRELNITLTGRAAGETDKAPMCGVPFHAADNYIMKLVKKGYKVAICEQMEDPKAVKGIVKRDVIRVITPGTVLSENGNDAKENNFLGVFYKSENVFVVLFSDVSTGEIIWSTVDADDNTTVIFDALAMYRPSEIVIAGQTVLPESVKDFIDNHFDNVVYSNYDVSDLAFSNNIQSTLEEKAKSHFDELTLANDSVYVALGYLLSYLESVLKADLSHLNYVHQLSVGNRMILDTSALRHLEVTHNLRDNGAKGTLLYVLDRTLTPMGSRLLKQWLESPLTDVGQIVRRQNAIGELVNDTVKQGKIRALLESIFDFERIISRIETGSVSPRDFTSLRESLRILPSLKEVLATLTSNALQDITAHVHLHEDMYALISRAIAEQPALTLREGKVIRDGYNEELDELRSLATNSQEWLQRMEEDVKTKTGLKLKTGYNKVFGYYFEVTHANTEAVPDYFIRKQTLTNAERYITPELKEFEIKILSAKEKIIALEQRLYQELREEIKQNIKPIQETARALAKLDVLVGLAVVAYEEQYVCPTITNNGHIIIKDGRHPVIEKFLKREIFVPNDTILNHNEEEFLLITGPNMAGKSTYMRQVAILMIMAQLGSFIPAREASISPVDRIFTRVGASDDISTGQSTFMVEMKEVAYILENATSNSLIVLDEIGRGTSTFDGLSIAQAVVEYICKHIRAKTLFATHYHELIPLEDTYKKLKNYTVAVKEKGKDVAFLRRIIRGGADRSYGIHVARLAGLPNTVLKRAELILNGLEKQAAALDVGGTNININGEIVGNESTALTTNMSAVADAKVHEANSFTGLDLFSNSVIDDLIRLDVMSMTPIEAMNTLYKLQEDAKRGGGK